LSEIINASNYNYNNDYNNNYNNQKNTKQQLSASEIERQIIKLGRKFQTDQALQIYQDCPQQTLTLRIWNAAIDACARAKPTRLQQAFDIFTAQTTLQPNVFTFGALMNACNRAGDADRAVRLLKDMQHNNTNTKYNVKPNAVVYSSAISACARAVTLSQQNNATKYKDLALQLLQQAVEVERLPMTVVGFNAAISACAQAADYKNALHLLQRMEQAQQRNSNNNNTSSSSSSSFWVPPPDAVTYGTVLAACERAQQWHLVLEKAQDIIVMMQTENNNDDNDDNDGSNATFPLDGLAIMSCLHACAELGKASDAMYFLNQLKKLKRQTQIKQQERQQQEQQQQKDASHNHKKPASSSSSSFRLGWTPLNGPDAVAYHVAISACARGGAWQDGIRLLEECKQELGNEAANVVAYTAAINGCEYAGQWKQAFLLLDKMRKENVTPNELTMCAVLGACATACANQYDETLTTTSNRNSRDDHPENESSPPLLPLPYKKGMQLLQVLKKDPTVVKPNIQIYNAAIRLCAEARQVQAAFDLLQEIQDANLERTQVTYGSLMTACERVGNVEYASRAFRKLKEEEEEQQHIAPNEIIYGAAISCCRKAKEPERALLLLKKMIKEGLSPNAACFNTVLIALTDAKRQKDSETVLQVYKLMKSDKYVHHEKPNRQTYNILIQFFAATSQPATAEAFLDKMRTEAQLKPDVDLFTATVAAYERTNQPLKAVRLMQRMESYGYDFYSVKVLNAAFKKAVNLVNAVGQNFASSKEEASLTTMKRMISNATNMEELEDDDDDDDDDDGNDNSF
jgi:pentatricopeptide repeat protein